MPAWRMPFSTMPSLRTSEGEASEVGEVGEEVKEAIEGTEGTEGEGTEGEGFTCSVCLCDLMAGEMVRTLPCKHLTPTRSLSVTLTLTPYPYPIPNPNPITNPNPIPNPNPAPTPTPTPTPTPNANQVRTLPCKHRFHMSCIDAWLTENSHVCPADGLPVLPDMST